MNSFKQALIQLKSHWQQSLILGALATALMVLTHNLPYISAFLISFELLVFQHVSTELLEKGNWKNFTFLKKGTPPILVVSLVLFPTSVLVGSSLGILQSPQDILTTAPAAWGLLILGTYFYFVLSHSLRLRLEENISIGKSIDIVGLASIKRLKLYFLISFYMGFFVLLSGLTHGVGFVLTLPLLFYTAHFSYLEMKGTGLFQKK